MNYYFRLDEEQVDGPVAVKEMRALILAGKIGPKTQVCPEGSSDWQALEIALPQLIKLLPTTESDRQHADVRPLPQESSALAAPTRVESVHQVDPGQVTRLEADYAGTPPTSLIANTGSTFAGYLLIHPLPVASGEAELWEAGRQGDRRVLKIYHRGLRPKPEVVELMQSLEPQHVVQVYETGEVDGRFYEVQEYIEAGSLADLTKLGGVGESTAREILQELAGALEHLHSRKPAILHRDIKPSNVLVRSLNPLNLVLTDFGIASAAELSQHKTSVSRTAAYAAPEALQGTVSKASDWWSVGVMLAELLTGRHPYAGMDEHAINYQIVTRGVPISAEIPERWRPLLQGLMTRDPARRWGDAEVRQWLAGKTSIPVHIDSALIAATHRPYKFAGQDYYDAAELGAALAQRWDEAVKHLGRGYIAKWVEDDLRDASLANTLADIAEDAALDAEQRLAQALLAMAPQLPLTWRGDVVTLDWIRKQLTQSKDLLNSTLPEWLDRIRSESWLLTLKRSWQSERDAFRRLINPTSSLRGGHSDRSPHYRLGQPASSLRGGHGVEKPDDFNLELADELLLLEEAPLVAEATRQAEAYGGSTNAAVDALLLKPEWNKLEAVMILVCPRLLLLTVEESRERSSCRASFPDLVCARAGEVDDGEGERNDKCTIRLEGECQPTVALTSGELLERLRLHEGDYPDFDLTSEQGELLAFAETEYLVLRGARPGGECERIELQDAASGKRVSLQSSCRRHVFPHQAGETVRIIFAAGGVAPDQLAEWAPIALLAPTSRSLMRFKPPGMVNQGKERWLPACTDTALPPDPPPALTEPTIEDPPAPTIDTRYPKLVQAAAGPVAIAALVLVAPVRLFISCGLGLSMAFVICAWILLAFIYAIEEGYKGKTDAFSFLAVCSFIILPIFYGILKLAFYGLNATEDPACSGTPLWFWPFFFIALAMVAYVYLALLKASHAEQVNNYTSEKAAAERKRSEAKQELERTLAALNREFAEKETAWRESVAVRLDDANALITRLRESLPKASQ